MLVASGDRAPLEHSLDIIHVEESQHKSVMTSDVSWFKLHEPFELVEEEA